MAIKSLVEDAELFFIEDYLSEDEADRLFELLNDENKFQLYNLYFYDAGKKEIVLGRNHRASYWLGEYAQAVQTCSKYVIDPDTGEKIHVPTDFVLPYEFPDELIKLKEKIEAQFNVQFNSCLVGKFESPTDKVGYHSDASDNMGEDPFIASLSLGKARNFLIKKNKKYINANGDHPIEQQKSRNPDIKLNLKHGSLLIMRENVNRMYLHAVPSDPGCNKNNCRINLTFRNYRYHEDEMVFTKKPF